MLLDCLVHLPSMSNTEQITTPGNNPDEASPNQQAVLDLISIVFQMQQQQLTMQEQMTRLMAQSIPTELKTAAQLYP